MSNSKSTTIFLVIAGIIGLYVGIGLTFFPVELQEGNGIMLPSASHFSETRAPGAAILSASMFILISIVKTSLRRNALGLSALFFLSYGFGRLLSVVFDGIPAEGLFYAMFGELILGAIALLLFMKTKPMN